MLFDLETARKVAAECGDAETARVVHSLISEVESSRKREAKLEEDLLDLQLRLSVLLTKLIPKKAGSDVPLGAKIRLPNGEILDEEYVAGLRGPRLYGVYMDEFADGMKNNGTV